VRLAESQKGFEVIEIVDIDRSTAKAHLGAHQRRADPAEEWTATGVVAEKDWRGTYGFCVTDEGAGFLSPVRLLADVES
jgi:hypothetical protein